MGIYINTEHGTKEEWLERQGKRFTLAQHAIITNNDGAALERMFKGMRNIGHVPVCLVDNDGFTAAGIAYSSLEMAALAHPTPRPTVWYAVPVWAIREGLPSVYEGMERYGFAPAPFDERDAATKAAAAEAGRNTLEDDLPGGGIGIDPDSEAGDPGSDMMDGLEPGDEVMADDTGLEA